jgi:hypothetical protein
VLLEQRQVNPLFLRKMHLEQRAQLDCQTPQAIHQNLALGRLRTMNCLHGAFDL